MGAEVEVVSRVAPPRAPGKKRTSTTLLHLLQLDNPDGVFVFAAAAAANKLPPPEPEPEAESLIDKIASCCRVFAFADDDAAERADERDAKLERLEEVLAAVRSSGKNQPPGLDHLVMVALVKMFAANLFRTMPPPATCPSVLAEAADEEAPAASLLPSWPHLQAVYDVLLAVIAAADAKALRNHIDRPFLTSLLALFASEDPRERDRLKTAYHQLYAKLTPERAFMRRSMAATLLASVHECGGGVAELLEICGSIINGFAVPLKEEHRGFLLRVLLPLHRARWLHAYHRQLVYCVLQFVHKEPVLAGAVVEGILRRWPVTNCQKEVLLIDELEEIVDALDQRQFDALAAPICSRIARCATSCSSRGGAGAVRVEQRAVPGDGVGRRRHGAHPAALRGQRRGQPGAPLEQVRAAGHRQRQGAAPAGGARPLRPLLRRPRREPGRGGRPGRRARRTVAEARGGRRRQWPER
ncbi:unnamed protein product [Triticum turgidum subsp. durum]|uniref:Serine/threonine protein phosphatase 2A regulatory subunit n=1 Tax=Triticum turgidum subsp. durum TaxID=4567 RepID=A0A9R0XEL9_TRITD|nr:unnamed protein product [Triticum turgidum subsp. durum]